MTEPASQADACAAIAATTEDHDRFKPFVGAFRSEVRMWMGPGDPSVSTGTMTNTLVLGGRYLQQDYKGDDGHFEGRGFWGYNTTKKKYEGLWIDSMSTFMQIDEGDVDAAGRTWTMIGDMINPESGAPMQKRSVITLEDEDHHSVAMYLTMPDGNAMKCMEIRYTRA